MTKPELVRANGVDLCVQTFGDAGDATLLLIAGAENSMDWWEDELCERLAAGRRYVIRYDFRDTGQSVTYEPGAPGYDGADLTADAVGVLDALGVERAHVVGMSMGGGIAQELALEHRSRVATLTLISTSFAVPRSADQPPLPPSAPELAEPVPEPDWSDREAVVDYILERLRPYRGSLQVDGERQRELVERVVDRTVNIESTLKNHSLIHGGEPVRGRLSDLNVPTLVLHGTEDPAFPLGHGEALAEEIPGARLLVLEGVGHELPPRPTWDRVVPAILEHTA